MPVAAERMECAWAIGIARNNSGRESANEIDETSTEEALHEADADEAQAAAGHHRPAA